MVHRRTPKRPLLPSRPAPRRSRSRPRPDDESDDLLEIVFVRESFESDG